MPYFIMYPGEIVKQLKLGVKYRSNYLWHINVLDINCEIIAEVIPALAYFSRLVTSTHMEIQTSLF